MSPGRPQGSKTIWPRVLELTLQGLTRKQIAERLGSTRMSVSAIRVRLRNEGKLEAYDASWGEKR